MKVFKYYSQEEVQQLKSKFVPAQICAGSNWFITKR